MRGCPAFPLTTSTPTLTWHVTRSWQVGLTVIARSLAYIRGNENNLHEPGGTDQEIGQYVCQNALCTQNAGASRPARSPSEGTTPGFAIVNFDTSCRARQGPHAVRAGQQSLRQGLCERRSPRRHAVLAFGERRDRSQRLELQLERMAEHDVPRPRRAARARGYGVSYRHPITQGESHEPIRTIVVPFAAGERTRYGERIRRAGIHRARQVRRRRAEGLQPDEFRLRDHLQGHEPAGRERLHPGGIALHAHREERRHRRHAVRQDLAQRQPSEALHLRHARRAERGSVGPER